MGILNANSTTNPPYGPLSIRRAVSIAAGLFCGITLSLHSIQPNHRSASVLAEAATSTSRPDAATRPAIPPKKVQDWHQIGLASWYGREFQGKETADGETFNMYDLTCAHRFLPLGTWVKVTNLHTRKWIVVRVNDRGPVPDTRIADLSSEAAHMLGMRNRGVTRVRLDVIDPKAAVEIARLDRIRMARLAAEQATVDAGD
ncbi:MAG: septal ring lytic transglycosylase RlpA family protein [Acidobacteriaceae bacterium]